MFSFNPFEIIRLLFIKSFFPLQTFCNWLCHFSENDPSMAKQDSGVLIFVLQIKSQSQVAPNKLKHDQNLLKSKTKFYYTCLNWHFVGLVYANALEFHFTWECLMLKIEFSFEMKAYRMNVTFEIQSPIKMSDKLFRRFTWDFSPGLLGWESFARKWKVFMLKHFVYAC